MPQVAHHARRPFLALSTLDAFRDEIVIRDPRGRSRHPALTLGRRDGERGLYLGDAFNMLMSYRVRPSQGRRFVDATGDENPIHREGNIVPGAMTVSKTLLPFEVLVPSFRTERLRIQFKAPAIYDQASRALFSWRRKGEQVQIQARVFQPSGIVAKCQILGSLGADPKPTRAPLLHSAGIDRVRSYFHSLRIDSRAFLDLGEIPNYVYPLAFIASLPSGEMVRSFQGHGGIINSLRLDFGRTERMPIGRDPEVLLEPSRIRTTFRKIVTRIVEGLETYCDGFALVHPTPPAESIAPRSD